MFRGVDLVACKSYSARGVVTIGMWFGDSFFVVLGEGGEEQPLLDSRWDVTINRTWYVHGTALP